MKQTVKLKVNGVEQGGHHQDPPQPAGRASAGIQALWCTGGLRDRHVWSLYGPRGWEAHQFLPHAGRPGGGQGAYHHRGARRRRQASPDSTGLYRAQCLQCAYCTPGFILTTKTFLEENPSPSVEEVRSYLAGNLCRCGSYIKIQDAVLDVARRLRGGSLSGS